MRWPHLGDLNPWLQKTPLGEELHEVHSDHVTPITLRSGICQPFIGRGVVYEVWKSEVQVWHMPHNLTHAKLCQNVWHMPHTWKCGICYPPPSKGARRSSTPQPCVSYATQAGAACGMALDGPRGGICHSGELPPLYVAYATVGKPPHSPDVAYATVGHGVAYATPAWTPLGSLGRCGICHLIFGGSIFPGI